jgi:uncharacterized protein YigA (DUF484 family)
MTEPETNGFDAFKRLLEEAKLEYKKKEDKIQEVKEELRRARELLDSQEYELQSRNADLDRMTTTNERTVHRLKRVQAELKEAREILKTKWLQ